MKNIFRTEKTYQKLHEYYATKPEGCFLCQREGKEFKYWKMVKNIFPYDKIASKHFMLTTKRHVADEDKLTTGERKELLELKTKILPKTDLMFFLESFPSRRSAKAHYHIHLIKWK
jgi:diadenosine tetraphosphate (Ap4A) HIT family hydrolase